MQPFQLRVVLKVYCSKLKNEFRSLNNKKCWKYKNAYIYKPVLFVCLFFLGISSAIKLSQESSLTCLKSKKCCTVKYRNCPGILARVYTRYKYPVYPPPKKAFSLIQVYKDSSYLISSSLLGSPRHLVICVRWTMWNIILVFVLPLCFWILNRNNYCFRQIQKLSFPL